MSDEPTSMLTINEVATYLKLHPLTVRRLARQGDIPAVKIGRQWRVKRDLLERWVEERSMSKLDKPGWRQRQCTEDRSSGSS